LAVEDLRDARMNLKQSRELVVPLDLKTLVLLSQELDLLTWIFCEFKREFDKFKFRFLADL